MGRLFFLSIKTIRMNNVVQIWIRKTIFRWHDFADKSS